MKSILTYSIQSVSDSLLVSLLKFPVVILACLGASLAHAEPQRLSDENVAFIYEARSSVPTPEHKLAAYISRDYARARDEFTKHELMGQLRPVIQERIAEGAATREVMLRVRGRLGDYDFDRKTFPTGFTDGSFIPFSDGYAVSFKNGDAMSDVSVNLDRAKSLSDSLRRNRRIVTTIFADVVNAEEKQLNRSRKKIINVRVSKIKVEMDGGAFVGEKIIN